MVSGANRRLLYRRAVPRFVYEHRGVCPICEAPATFSASNPWFRDHLVCPSCGSIPRERALAVVLNSQFPGWRAMAIHESSPAQRGISVKLARDCADYTATQFFPDEPLGATVRGFRNENLEHQTFGDAAFDLVISLDVMEHVNEPQAVLSEVWRTLRPNGAYIFTTPTFKDLTNTQRWARYLPNGGTEFLVEPPEYHGNPISDKGSLVTYHYGYDLPELIAQWAPFATTVHRFHDPKHGILGEFTEVYVCVKEPRSDADPATERRSWGRLRRPSVWPKRASR
jgi:SAM-dependent methyltransferase